MYDHEFLSLIREHSLGIEIDDLRREWNLFSFRFDAANCNTCRVDTQKTVIFSHDQLVRELILCPRCARIFNPTCAIKSISAYLVMS